MKASHLLSLVLAIALVVVCAKFAVNGKSDNKDNENTEQRVDSAVINAIMKRSSIRSYTNKDVEKEKITTLLKAGMAAPTAADKRPWHFVAVTDKNILRKYAEVNPYASMAAEAPLMIVVCGDMEKAIEGEANEMWVQDASAATENILLAAEALGLGAVWTGVWPLQDRVQAVSDLLNLPGAIVPMAAVVIGYPKTPGQPKNKYNESNVSWNTYDLE